MSEKVSVKVTAAPVILAWPQLFEPKAPQLAVGTAAPVYSGNFVFDPDHADLKTLKAEAGKLLRAMRPTVDLKTLRPHSDFGYPFKSGEQVVAEAQKSAAKKSKVYQGGADYNLGKVVLFAKAKVDYPPQLAVFDNGRWIDLDSPELRAMHKGKFYPGVEVYGSFSLMAYEITDRNWGVTCYLNGVGSTGKGLKIGGGLPPAAEMYPTVTGSVSSENPMADDEIPF